MENIMNGSCKNSGEVILTIKGTQFSDWYIKLGKMEPQSLEGHKDNFGILSDVTKIVFHISNDHDWMKYMIK